MKTIIGVMGSAEETANPMIDETAHALGEAIAARDLILFTDATTGVIRLVGRAARDAGAFHIGVSPAENQREHVLRFQLPADACDAIVYTGFGLKGRNVVLIRSCDIVVFIAGSIGSLNEFTIAYDEGKVIGCLTDTGGVADEIERLMKLFSKRTKSKIFYHNDPVELLQRCMTAI